jgi:23S rRNA pseudouridine2605 synthase
MKFEKKNYSSSSNKPKKQIKTSRTSVKKRSYDEQPDNSEIRLNKYIADSGYSSRRKADELIDSGVVKVNGRTVTELGTKISSDAEVTVNGDPVSNRKRLVYILLNKPKDFITTTDDEKNRKTVMDLIKSHTRVYPVGRLDRNSTGVLLLTNDGELSYRLTHPKYEIKKVYNVQLDRSLETSDAKRISEGVELDDGVTAPCEIFIDVKESYKITMILQEGKNREIRRIFESFDYNVKKLDRKFFATLSVSGMSRGEYRHLTFKELRDLKKSVGM